MSDSNINTVVILVRIVLTEKRIPNKVMFKHSTRCIYLVTKRSLFNTDLSI